LNSGLYEAAVGIYSGDPTTKPLSYYEHFDNFLDHHSIDPRSILEIGTYLGESTLVLSGAFPKAEILTIDNFQREIAFDRKNISYQIIDQTDKKTLEKKILRKFPNGLDLVIDDASHYGYNSKLSFEIIFPLLKSGGAYFIEDWGTGYWDDWFDGNRYQEFEINYTNGQFPKRIPSHDFGMVGFVKSLVDLTHESAINRNLEKTYIQKTRIKTLEFGEGVCMVLKA
jgi:hypothetical protein